MSTEQQEEFCWGGYVGELAHVLARVRKMKKHAKNTGVYWEVEELDKEQKKKLFDTELYRSPGSPSLFIHPGKVYTTKSELYHIKFKGPKVIQLKPNSECRHGNKEVCKWCDMETMTNRHFNNQRPNDYYVVVKAFKDKEPDISAPTTFAAAIDSAKLAQDCLALVVHVNQVFDNFKTPQERARDKVNQIVLNASKDGLSDVEMRELSLAISTWTAATNGRSSRWDELGARLRHLAE